MAFWRARKEAKTASLVEALTTAFATALTGVLAAQTKQIETSSTFLNTLQDLSAKKAAQVMGSRGGRSTQRRKKAAQRAAAEAEGRGGCALCNNPARRDVTLEMLAIHRAHGEPEQDAPQRQITFNNGTDTDDVSN
jgi:hypothetical protein